MAEILKVLVLQRFSSFRAVMQGRGSSWWRGSDTGTYDIMMEIRRRLGRQGGVTKVILQHEPWDSEGRATGFLRGSQGAAAAWIGLWTVIRVWWGTCGLESHTRGGCSRSVSLVNSLRRR